jgi:prepilin-type N-terminal cleavage/methylation domain-containing protein
MQAWSFKLRAASFRKNIKTMQNKIKNKIRALFKIQKTKSNLDIVLNYKLTAPSSKLQASFGFSLIELIITISIMLIMSTAILFRQAKFSSDILITNMAYEIALSIREASIYGVSGRVGQGPVSQAGYGLRFSMDPTDQSKYNQYFAFTDEPTTDAPAGQDNVYNYFFDPNSGVIPADSVIGSNIIMSQGFIRRFCGVNSNGTYDCVNEGDTGVLDIVFVKPDPEANIRLANDSLGDELRAVSDAIIVIESALGDKCRTIRVSGAGQASVDPTDPSDPSMGCDVGLP